MESSQSMINPLPTSKARPGRNLLIFLAVVVFVFIDFETTALNPYRYGGAEESSYDSQHALQQQQQQQQQHVEDRIIQRMQQQQLIIQLDRMAGANTTAGVPDGLVEIEPTESISQNVTTTTTINVTAGVVEEINIEEEKEAVTVPVNNTKKRKHPFLINNTEDETAVVNASTDKTQHNANDVPLYPPECTMHNSRPWLEGTRISNAYTNMTDEFVYNLVNVTQLIHRADTITSTTVCHKDGTFRSQTPSTTWDLSDERLLSEWQFRLTYLSIHYHMHKPAMRELEARRACGHPLPAAKMDFECKDAKFLVANMGKMGLGASFRLGAIVSLWMGIVTDRITVFVNHAKVGPRFLQNPWPLASCERKDAQCFFLPATPCVLTMEDVQNATLLEESMARHLRRGGSLPDSYNETRVLIAEPSMIPSYTNSDKIRNALHRIASTMIDEIEESDWKVFLKAAAKRIQDVDARLGNSTNPHPMFGNVTEYGYSMKDSHIPHACLLYVMRPNVAYQALSNEISAAALPANLDPEVTIGLPVRGSDKCRRESICLNHELYMELMHLTRNSLFKNASQPTKVILTTEDESILKASKAYQARADFPFEFLTNDQDVLQGTGAPKHYQDKADQIMLTTIVALKMQLHGRIVYGNCCSNFHLMLFDMLREGCGVHRSPILSCLQEHPDRRFNICCGWSTSDECNATREAIRAAREAAELNQTKM